MDDSLVSLYKKQLGLQKAHFSLIEHEDAIIATVYKVTLTSGEKFVLKICSRINHYLREVFFLNHFAGKLLVPRIIGLVQPEREIQGAILMDCLSGQGFKVATLNEKLIYEVGSSLACIHLQRVKGYGDLTQPAHLHSDPRTYFTVKFEEGLSECTAHLSARMSKKCRLFYDQHINSLVSADGPCMVHGDFRPSNVFFNDNRLQGIIDWSSAHSGFAEEDFFPLEFGEWSNNAKIKNSFLEGYNEIRKIPNCNHIMPFLQLSRAIAIIGFTIKSETWESRNAVLYQLYLQSLKSLLKED